MEGETVKPRKLVAPEFGSAGTNRQSHCQAQAVVYGPQRRIVNRFQTSRYVLKNLVKQRNFDLDVHSHSPCTRAAGGKNEQMEAKLESELDKGMQEAVFPKSSEVLSRSVSGCSEDLTSIDCQNSSKLPELKLDLQSTSATESNIACGGEVTSAAASSRVEGECAKLFIEESRADVQKIDINTSLRKLIQNESDQTVIVCEGKKRRRKESFATTEICCFRPHGSQLSEPKCIGLTSEPSETQTLKSTFGQACLPANKKRSITISDIEILKNYCPKIIVNRTDNSKSDSVKQSFPSEIILSESFSDTCKTSVTRSSVQTENNFGDSSRLPDPVPSTSVDQKGSIENEEEESLDVTIEVPSRTSVCTLEWPTNCEIQNKKLIQEVLSSQRCSKTEMLEQHIRINTSRDSSSDVLEVCILPSTWERERVLHDTSVEEVEKIPCSNKDDFTHNSPEKQLATDVEKLDHIPCSNTGDLAQDIPKRQLGTEVEKLDHIPCSNKDNIVQVSPERLLTTGVEKLEDITCSNKDDIDYDSSESHLAIGVEKLDDVYCSSKDVIAHDCPDKQFVTERAGAKRRRKRVNHYKKRMIFSPKRRSTSPRKTAQTPKVVYSQTMPALEKTFEIPQDALLTHLEAVNNNDTGGMTSQVEKLEHETLDHVDTIKESIAENLPENLPETVCKDVSAFRVKGMAAPKSVKLQRLIALRHSVGKKPKSYISKRKDGAKKPSVTHHIKPSHKDFGKGAVYPVYTTATIMRKLARTKLWKKSLLEMIKNRREDFYSTEIETKPVANQDISTSPKRSVSGKAGTEKKIKDNAENRNSQRRRRISEQKSRREDFYNSNIETKPIANQEISIFSPQNKDLLGKMGTERNTKNSKEKRNTQTRRKVSEGKKTVDMNFDGKFVNTDSVVELDQKISFEGTSSSVADTCSQETPLSKIDDSKLNTQVLGEKLKLMKECCSFLSDLKRRKIVSLMKVEIKKMERKLSQAKGKWEGKISVKSVSEGALSCERQESLQDVTTDAIKKKISGGTKRSSIALEDIEVNLSVCKKKHRIKGEPPEKAHTGHANLCIVLNDQKEDVGRRSKQIMPVSSFKEETKLSSLSPVYTSSPIPQRTTKRNNKKKACNTHKKRHRKKHNSNINASACVEKQRHTSEIPQSTGQPVIESVGDETDKLLGELGSGCFDLENNLAGCAIDIVHFLDDDSCTESETNTLFSDEDLNQESVAFNIKPECDYSDSQRLSEPTLEKGKETEACSLMKESDITSFHDMPEQLMDDLHLSSSFSSPGSENNTVSAADLQQECKNESNPKNLLNTCQNAERDWQYLNVLFNTNFPEMSQEEKKGEDHTIEIAGDVENATGSSSPCEVPVSNFDVDATVGSTPMNTDNRDLNSNHTSASETMRKVIHDVGKKIEILPKQKEDTVMKEAEISSQDCVKDFAKTLRKDVIKEEAVQEIEGIPSKDDTINDVDEVHSKFADGGQSAEQISDSDHDDVLSIYAESVSVLDNDLAMEEEPLLENDSESAIGNDVDLVDAIYYEEMTPPKGVTKTRDSFPSFGSDNTCTGLPPKSSSESTCSRETEAKLDKTVSFDESTDEDSRRYSEKRKREQSRSPRKKNKIERTNLSKQIDIEFTDDDKEIVKKNSIKDMYSKEPCITTAYAKSVDNTNEDSKKVKQVHFVDRPHLQNTADQSKAINTDNCGETVTVHTVEEMEVIVDDMLQPPLADDIVPQGSAVHQSVNQSEIQEDPPLIQISKPMKPYGYCHGTVDRGSCSRTVCHFKHEMSKELEVYYGTLVLYYVSQRKEHLAWLILGFRMITSIDSPFVPINILLPLARLLVKGSCTNIKVPAHVTPFLDIAKLQALLELHRGLEAYKFLCNCYNSLPSHLMQTVLGEFVRYCECRPEKDAFSPWERMILWKYIHPSGPSNMFMKHLFNIAWLDFYKRHQNVDMLCRAYDHLCKSINHPSAYFTEITSLVVKFLTKIGETKLRYFVLKEVRRIHAKDAKIMQLLIPQNQQFAKYHVPETMELVQLVCEESIPLPAHGFTLLIEAVRGIDKLELLLDLLSFAVKGCKYKPDERLLELIILDSIRNFPQLMQPVSDLISLLEAQVLKVLMPTLKHLLQILHHTPPPSQQMQEQIIKSCLDKGVVLLDGSEENLIRKNYALGQSKSSVTRTDIRGQRQIEDNKITIASQHGRSTTDHSLQPLQHQETLRQPKVDARNSQPMTTIKQEMPRPLYQRSVSVLEKASPRKLHATLPPPLHNNLPNTQFHSLINSTCLPAGIQVSVGWPAKPSVPANLVRLKDSVEGEEEIDILNVTSSSDCLQEKTLGRFPEEKSQSTPLPYPSSEGGITINNACMEAQGPAVFEAVRHVRKPNPSWINSAGNTKVWKQSNEEEKSGMCGSRYSSEVTTKGPLIPDCDRIFIDTQGSMMPSVMECKELVETGKVISQDQDEDTEDSHLVMSIIDILNTIENEGTPSGCRQQLALMQIFRALKMDGYLVKAGKNLQKIIDNLKRVHGLTTREKDLFGKLAVSLMVECVEHKHLSVAASLICLLLENDILICSYLPMQKKALPSEQKLALVALKTLYSVNKMEAFVKILEDMYWSGAAEDVKMKLQFLVNILHMQMKTLKPNFANNVSRLKIVIAIMRSIVKYYNYDISVLMNEYGNIIDVVKCLSHIWILSRNTIDPQLISERKALVNTALANGICLPKTISNSEKIFIPSNKLQVEESQIPPRPQQTTSGQSHNLEKPKRPNTARRGRPYQRAGIPMGVRGRPGCQTEGTPGNTHFSEKYITLTGTGTQGSHQERMGSVTVCLEDNQKGKYRRQVKMESDLAAPSTASGNQRMNVLDSRFLSHDVHSLAKKSSAQSSPVSGFGQQNSYIPEYMVNTTSRQKNQFAGKGHAKYKKYVYKGSKRPLFQEPLNTDI